MFLHSHLYFSQLIFGKKMNNLIALGSFLPDIRITKVVDWRQSHSKEQGLKLKTFISQNKPSYLDLAKGFQSHIFLDKLTHGEFKKRNGYAYRKSAPLIKITALSSYLEPELAKRVSHNFIELAVDILILKDNPLLTEFKNKVIEQVDKKTLSALMAVFFQVSEEKMAQSLKQYFTLLLSQDLSKLDGWVELWAIVNKLNFGLKVKRKLVRKAILQAIGIVKNSYLDFFKQAVILYKKGGK